MNSNFYRNTYVYKLRSYLLCMQERPNLFGAVLHICVCICMYSISLSIYLLNGGSFFGLQWPVYFAIRLIFYGYRKERK